MRKSDADGEVCRRSASEIDAARNEIQLSPILNVARDPIIGVASGVALQHVRGAERSDRVGEQRN